jgi:glycosyltransferase involved in cell wall biosynthesis
MTIGVAIPSIPPRRDMLLRAVGSVLAQSLPVDQISIVLDTAKRGASFTRNDAWQALDTDYVAFLDDDDEWYPHHLATCLQAIEATGADMVYPWFDVAGGTDPFPENFGRPFDPTDPCQTTITCLWRRRALRDVGGFIDVPADDDPDQSGHRRGEDMRAVERLVALGGKVVHVPERTWAWHHHLANTSGLPDRWAA